MKSEQILENRKNLRKRLYAGTVPANKKYVAGTVPANKEYAAGTVPAIKKYAAGTFTLNMQSIDT